MYRIFVFKEEETMRFQRYTDTDSFSRDVRDVLLEDEAQNFLQLSFLGNKTDAVKNWLLATVKNDDGGVILTAACTPPFNIVLYETKSRPNDAALKLLSEELKSAGFALPGVLAEQGLAHRFAETYARGSYRRHMSIRVMRLDTVADIKKAPGFCRPVREEDLFFAPYWGRAFGEDCRVEVYSIPEMTEQIRKHIGRDKHYIWEDGQPVSQAVNEHVTPNGAIISNVYTPPHYRGRGYASACVASLSQLLLDRGHKFCALFADTENPVSCGIYRKLGYKDQCGFAEIKFI